MKQYSESDSYRGELMKAMVIKSFGNADVFEEAEVDRPHLNLLPNHVLIQVKAAGLNPVDIKIRKGILAKIAPEFPAILHSDVAGIIVSVGSHATKFKVGDSVYGCAGGVKGSSGSLAEYMIADEKLLALKPMTLDFKQAAALPLVAITAWEALFDRAQIRPDQTVYIPGATGGVAHIAIQLAKSVGCQVISTASSEEKIKIGKQLGADWVINHKEDDVVKNIQENISRDGIDIVFDTLGGDNLEKSFEIAKIGGTVMTISASHPHDLTLLKLKGLTLHAVFMLIPLLHGLNRQHHGEILEKIAHLVDEGKLKPLLHHEVFSFNQVAKAHEALELKQVMGKVVLCPDEAIFI
jgi:NADPH2:quinone reductase